MIRSMQFNPSPSFQAKNLHKVTSIKKVQDLGNIYRSLSYTNLGENGAILGIHNAEVLARVQRMVRIPTQPTQIAKPQASIVHTL